MAIPITQNLLRTGILIAQLMLVCACNEQSKTSGDLVRNSSGKSVARQPGAASAANANEPAPYFGEIDSPPPKGNGAQTTASPPNKAESQQQTTTWSLVLGTFTGEGHAQAANEMIRTMRSVAPQVTGARVHTTPRGSMVVYGNYTSRDDPKAKDDEERLKAIRYENRQVFTRIILTHIDLRLSQAELHPHDLLSARKANPTVNPLYTLDVAIWMTNEDPKAGKDRLTFEEAKRKAEAYAAELRARKEQAYFYHDEVNRLSIVTVGLFNSKAINPKSKLYSPDVDALIARFPVRLANGEPLMEFRDRFNPKLGTVPQRPKLVLVPAM